MAITPLPLPVPESTMSEAVFDDAANAFLGALPAFATEANALADDVNEKQGIATTQAGVATTQAGIATTQAGVATTQAGTATAQAGIATTKAGEADTSADNAAISLAQFRATYLGPLASDPTLDGNGDPVANGAWYDNTVSETPRIRRGGVWVDAVFEVIGGFSGAYADLSGKPTLGTAAAQNTDAFATAAQGGKADSAVQPARNITAGTGLTGGGTLAADRTINLDKATGANIRAGTSDKVITADGIPDALALITPSGGSNFAPDFNTFMVADWNVTANRTLSNPTNAAPGETRYLFIRGSSGTARTITFGSNYKGALPTLNDVTSTKWYLLTMVAYSSSHIVVAAVQAL